MIQLRPFASLGGFRNDWLNARHHFSFGQYNDRKRMGFGRLRVWNDDEVAPGMGFDPHPHQEMEIVTYIRQGAITHRDNLGNEGRTEAGDVQVMHAGTGIVHAEYNLEDAPTRLFQIWIQPDRHGVKPGWGTRQFPRNGGLAILASGRAQDAGSDALTLNADAAVMAGTLHAGETARLQLPAGRGIYLVPATGSVTLTPGATQGANATTVGTRDGAAITNEAELLIAANSDTELLLVDVAA